MEVLGWVDNVPEHVVIWVAADWIIKEASDILKEARAHVARTVGIAEAIRSKVAGDIVEECVDIIGQHSGARVSGWVLLDQVGHHCVEHRHIGIKVGLQEDNRISSVQSFHSKPSMVSLPSVSNDFPHPKQIAYWPAAAEDAGQAQNCSQATNGDNIIQSEMVSHLAVRKHQQNVHQLI